MYIFINIYRQICSLSISNSRKRETSLSDQNCSTTQSFITERVFFCFFDLDFIKINPWSTSRIAAALNSKEPASFSAVYGTSEKEKKKEKKKEQEEKKQKIMGEEKKIKVKTLNPPKCMCCLAIVCSKSVIRKKLSLWHNHCFLCCIDSKMFKWKKKEKETKKKHLEKRSIFVQR